MATPAPQEEERQYLIMYGAPSGRSVRKILHIGHVRDGELVPRCNTHYTASHDRQTRRFRAPEGDELEFPVCKRCLAWNGWAW